MLRIWFRMRRSAVAAAGGGGGGGCAGGGIDATLTTPLQYHFHFRNCNWFESSLRLLYTHTVGAGVFRTCVRDFFSLQTHAYVKFGGRRHRTTP